MRRRRRAIPEPEAHKFRPLSLSTGSGGCASSPLSLALPNLSRLPSAEGEHHVAEEVSCAHCLGRCGAVRRCFSRLLRWHCWVNTPCAVAGEDPLQASARSLTRCSSKPAGDDWLLRRGNFAGWGYSALDRINTHNVGQLRLAWAWNMELGYQEGAPLAHDGVLFLANPKNVVQALRWAHGRFVVGTSARAAKDRGRLSQRSVQSGARHHRALRRQGGAGPLPTPISSRSMRIPAR